MKATIKDVAKHAGVSIKTVSRVTNNEASVRQITKDKVNEAIKKLKYSPNLSARNLAATSSFVIAFVYDNPNAYYIIDMQNGILSACREKGYELLIHPCDSKSDKISEQLVTMVENSRVSGLILTPPLSENADIIKSLDEINANYIRIIAGNNSHENQEKIQRGVVFVNDSSAAKAITSHLLKLGHEKIAFLSGDKDHKSTEERLKGFIEALSEFNMLPLNEHIIDGEYSFESGVKGAQQLLSHHIKPTAIVACNDEIAAGALFAARLAGVDIPNELSIVGFENSPFSRQTWPKLTTVHQPTTDIAHVATKMLIANTKSADAAQSVVFTPKPVLRDSSGPISTKPT